MCFATIHKRDHGGSQCNCGLFSPCYNNVFSLGQADGHHYHDSSLHKPSRWVENCTKKSKFGYLILSKII